MNAQQIRSWSRALALASLVLALPAFAQDNPAPAAPPDTLASDTTAAPGTPAPAAAAAAPAAAAAVVSGDTLLTLPMVVTLRSKEAIDAEKARMSDIVTASLNHVSARKTNATREQAQVDIKKGEISDINKQIDAAKKEKRDGDKKNLEAQKKKLEAQQKYLEKVRDWHNAEAAFQQTLSNYAQARIDEGTAEANMLALGDLSTAEARQKVETRNAAARVIAAIKARAERGSDLAQDERAAADKRKAVLDAYTVMANM